MAGFFQGMLNDLPYKMHSCLNIQHVPDSLNFVSRLFWKELSTNIALDRKVFSKISAAFYIWELWSAVSFHCQVFPILGSPQTQGKKSAMSEQCIWLCLMGKGLLLSLPCCVSPHSSSKCSKCNTIMHLENSTLVFFPTHLAQLVMLFQQRALAYCQL